MNRLTAFFNSEVYRPLVTLVIPGAIVSIFYILVLHTYMISKIPEISDFSTYQGTIVLLLAFTAAGHILEDIGSRIEKKIDERLDKKSGGQHLANWNKYLQLAFTVEPVGQRYLRTVLLRMKFEMSLGLAIFFAIPGMLIFFSQKEITCGIKCGLTLFFVALGSYAFYEANSGCRLLGDIRSILVDKYGDKEN